jgi:hypothetical protein
MHLPVLVLQGHIGCSCQGRLRGTLGSSLFRCAAAAMLAGALPVRHTKATLTQFMTSGCSVTLRLCRWRRPVRHHGGRGRMSKLSITAFLQCQIPPLMDGGRQLN